MRIGLPIIRACLLERVISDFKPELKSWISRCAVSSARGLAASFEGTLQKL